MLALLYRALIYQSTTYTNREESMPDPEAELPLTPATFHVLLALVDGERHGYAIMREVGERTDGAVRLGPGTLYGTLKRLLEGGLVAEAAERADPELGDERRRYYRVTDFGLAVARAEARRLEGLVRAARGKRLLGLEPA
jgi:DNA-binding PadR family transcriptional regulator